MRLRGIQNYNKFITGLGFAPATARNFQGFGVRRINFEHLERICLALNCTPNDLLEWHPADNQATPETQALIKLTRNQDVDISKLLSTLPMEKFEQIAEILQDSSSK